MYIVPDYFPGDAEEHEPLQSGGVQRSTAEKIVYHGDTSIFLIMHRSEILDLTMCSEQQSSKIAGWIISNEAPLSDPKHTLFQLALGKPEDKRIRNPRNALWNSYKEVAKCRHDEFSITFVTIDEFKARRGFSANGYD